MAGYSPPPPSKPAFDAEEISALLQRFVDTSGDSVEASVDNLVRVRVGRAMNVTAVEFLDPALDSATRLRLEPAVLAAVNAALHKAALAAGAALVDFQRQKTGRTNT
jgi:hypothetical protein